MLLLDLSELYRRYKPLLFSLAYRMLGTVMDAEDIVQDIFLTVSKQPLENIRNLKAFMCKITTNRCLDVLKSAKKQREVYIGPWLPEPLLFQDEDDPLQNAIGKEYLSLAYLKVMEILSPAERAVFLLREAFGFDFKEIAAMLNKSEANCRKILSRAKQKLPIQCLETNLNYEQNKQIILNFIDCFEKGNAERLLQLVSQEVVLYSDGGGQVTAAIRPIITIDRVLPFLHGIYMKLPENLVSTIQNINGQPGIVNYIDHKPHSIISFSIDSDQIREILIVLNPNKLKHLQK